MFLWRWWEGVWVKTVVKFTPSGPSLGSARDKSGLVPSLDFARDRLGKGDRKDRADTEVCPYKDDLTPNPFPLREGEGRMQCAPTKTKHKGGRARDLPL